MAIAGQCGVFDGPESTAYSSRGMFPMVSASIKQTVYNRKCVKFDSTY